MRFVVTVHASAPGTIRCSPSAATRYSNLHRTAYSRLAHESGQETAKFPENYGQRRRLQRIIRRAGGFCLITANPHAVYSVPPPSWQGSSTCPNEYLCSCQLRARGFYDSDEALGVAGELSPEWTREPGERGGFKLIKR